MGSQGWDSSGLLNSRSLLHRGGNSAHSKSGGEDTGEGSDDGGVVDDVVGGVGGHVLLDSNMGNVVDLVVDVVTDMLDHGGGMDDGSSMDQVLDWDGGSWGDVEGNSGGSLDLHSLDLHRLHGRSSNVLNGRGGHDRGVDDLDSLADGINESGENVRDVELTLTIHQPVLVEVL